MIFGTRRTTRRFRVMSRRLALCVTVALALSFCTRPDMASPNNDHVSDLPVGSPTPSQVKVALGWRAKEVERRSTGPVRFHDDDYSVVIVEEGPVALAYADPAHAFILPEGRYLRLDQAAGRVYVASASPQMDVLDASGAMALADSIVRLLEGAGWARVADVGLGVRDAVSEAARAVTGAGTGTVDVGAWQIPRSPEQWAALPPDPLDRQSLPDGVRATLTVRPMKRRSAADNEPRLLLTLRISDALLSGTLNAMVESRRARNGGEKQSLASWEQMPNEPLAVGGPR